MIVLFIVVAFYTFSLQWPLQVQCSITAIQMHGQPCNTLPGIVHQSRSLWCIWTGIVLLNSQNLFIVKIIHWITGINCFMRVFFHLKVAHFEAGHIWVKVCTFFAVLGFSYHFRKVMRKLDAYRGHGILSTYRFNINYTRNWHKL